MKTVHKLLTVSLVDKIDYKSALIIERYQNILEKNLSIHKIVVSFLKLFVKLYESKENFMQYSQIDSSDIMYQYTAVEINQLLILFDWERPQMNTHFPSKLYPPTNFYD